MLGHHVSGSGDRRGADRAPLGDRWALRTMPKSAAPAPSGHHAERKPARYRILYERQWLGEVLLGEKTGSDQAWAEILQSHRVERGLLATTVYQPAGQLRVDVTQAGRRERRGKFQAELGSDPGGAEPWPVSRGRMRSPSRLG